MSDNEDYLDVFKYHIRKDGNPGICVAAPGKCPISSDEEHFVNPRVARDWYEKNSVRKFGSLKSHRKIKWPDKTREEKRLELNSLISYGMNVLKVKGYRIEWRIIIKDKDGTYKWDIFGQTIPAKEKDGSRSVSRIIMSESILDFSEYKAKAIAIHELGHAAIITKNSTYSNGHNNLWERECHKIARKLNLDSKLLPDDYRAKLTDIKDDNDIIDMAKHFYDDLKKR